MRLFTIGHSNRSFDDLVDLLREHDIEVLVDVRRWPSSRRNPQFSQERLKESLEDRGIGYVWLGHELGGRRKKGLGDDSPNKAWSSKGFRNYADHTLTEGFQKGIEMLLRCAEKRRVAYMCAEKFPWRCHRRIISDYLKAQGHQVTHIIDNAKVMEHELPEFAQIKNGKLSYPLRG